MQIPIPIPRWMVRVWGRFGNWGNVVVWEHGRFYLYRLDLLMAAGFLICVGEYGYLYGWLGTVKGGVSFVVMVALALLVRR